jgi:aspartyl-tRNA(Asn)/glutamyl-tRNA(Gln) amidotransferase subunit A
LGRVSVHGLIPSTYYQDTAGPLTRSVADCALLMNAIAGYDPSDPLSAQLPVPDYTAVLDGDVKGLRVGVINEARDAAHLHPEIKAQLDDAVQRFARMGAAVEDVSLPLIGLSSTFSGALGSPRVALQWTFLRDRPRDYDTAARLFSLLPALMPASLLQRAMQLRSLIRDQMLAAFERYDVLLLPSYSSPSARIEDTKVPAGSKEQIVAGLRRFNFATPANIAGIPAISVPAGFTSDGLPFGLQIMGGRFDEESVFRAAFAYEQDTPWHTMRPSFGDE